MFTLSRLWNPIPDNRELLASIAAVGPRAREWAERQDGSGAELSALGRSALDGIPQEEALRVASLILGTIRRRRSNAGLLAAAGLALLDGPRGFSLVRSLFKVFVEIERVRQSESPVVVLARLGNQLPVADGRVLLAFMAELGQLDAASRQLAGEASEVDAPHPKLVFRALSGGLPDTVSQGCSAVLRHDLLVVRLMTQERAKPSLWQRLSWALRGLVAA